MNIKILSEEKANYHILLSVVNISTGFAGAKWNSKTVINSSISYSKLTLTPEKRAEGGGLEKKQLLQDFDSYEFAMKIKLN